MAADAVSAALLFFIVAVLRTGTQDVDSVAGALGIDVQTVAVVYGLGWAGVLGWLGLYQLRSRWTFRSEFVAILRATVTVVLATGFVLYAFKLDVVSRLFLVSLFGTQPILTAVSRFVMRTIFAHYRARGRNLRYILIVGAGHEAQSFADKVEGFTALGLRVIGHVTGPGDSIPTVSRPVLGTVDDLDGIAHARIVDEVALCLTQPSGRTTRAVTALCATEGKTLRMPLDTPTMGEGRVDEFEGMQVLSLTFGPTRVVSLAAKKVTDLVLAAAGIVALSPLLLVIAIRIRLVDGGPVLFRQTRVGLHGREFTVYKFRTMVPDAEAHLAELQHLNERTGPIFKMDLDPRISRTGRFLRASSLDELPQLLNVLRGEMSIVGPRPPLPHEVKRYDVWHRRRLSMKPGITGLWQIEARNNPDFDKWVERDLSYIDRWSLWLDFKIIARTIPAVVIRAGR